jgi:hypothetical protein
VAAEIELSRCWNADQHGEDDECAELERADEYRAP